ncbi:unnamed protein product [Cuscuta europaea]|uniref:MULE transposase domain-containing protein n=1 Tax=Cuscuta europaea TaxID=41803 RepID=A0A9P0YHG6_CUSEU|nr:unnamed protein product [Cuscuta europaea]
MDSIVMIMLKLGGSWTNDYNFNSNLTFAIQVLYSSTYKDFIEQLSSILSDSYNATSELKLSYMVDGCPPPVYINDEASFRFFLNLKVLQTDFSKYPLCVEFSIHGYTPCSVPATENTVPIYASPSHVSSEEHDNISGQKSDSNSYTIFQHESNLTQKSPSPITINDDVYHSPLSSVSPCQSPPTHLHSTESFSFHHNVEVITHYHPTQIMKYAIYNSKFDLSHHLKLYAIDNGFQYRTLTSKKGVLHVVCCDDNCKWAVRGVKLLGVQMFQIRRFDSTHTCSIDFRQGKQRQATYRTVAELISHKFLDASRKPYAPNLIREDMSVAHGISMSYKKAWKAQKLAMQRQFGSDFESYQKLPSMAYMLEKRNLNSVISLIIGDEDEFRYFFMCLSPWRQAWDFCRPVLIVDGSFMKAYYKGTLLTACGQDANGHIVPLAFGICDSESKASWNWFLSQVRDSITFRPDMFIVSDRHEGILGAVKDIFPHALHGYCVEHLRRNMVPKFRGAGKNLGWKFKAAYMASTLKEFEEYMSLLDSEDIRIRPWLEKIGFEKWAKCMSGPRRYDIMTSNCAESMNNVNVSAREYSTSKLVDFLRERMQQWFSERKENAEKTRTFFAPTREKHLVALQGQACRMQVTQCVLNAYTFIRKKYAFDFNYLFSYCILYLAAIPKI